MNVIDASALLAFLQGEKGADRVDRILDEGGSCGAASWSEVAQKVRAAGRDWPSARQLLSTYRLTVVSVTAADAEHAAAMWAEVPALSLGDRLCLARGHRLGGLVWTADRAWGDDAPVRQIR